ncbi:hypothetical protein CR513_15826, partial [Mucuna pruriens]
MMDRSLINAASGGALMDKTAIAARHLISNMASNTQQLGIRGASQPRVVNEIGAVDNLRLENQLTELTSLVRQLVVRQHQPIIAARICGVCTSVEHPTNMCATLQKTELDHPKSVGAIGVWEAIISTRVELRAICGLAIQTYPKCTSRSNRLSTTDSAIPDTTVLALAASNLELHQTMNSNNMQFQQNMNATIQDLKMQIEQLANTVSHLQSTGFGNLPSQTISNPRLNASAVTLRSGKELP